MRAVGELLGSFFGPLRKPLFSKDLRGELFGELFQLLPGFHPSTGWCGQPRLRLGRQNGSSSHSETVPVVGIGELLTILGSFSGSGEQKLPSRRRSHLSPLRESTYRRFEAAGRSLLNQQAIRAPPVPGSFRRLALPVPHSPDRPGAPARGARGSVPVGPGGGRHSAAPGGISWQGLDLHPRSLTATWKVQYLPRLRATSHPRGRPIVTTGIVVLTAPVHPTRTTGTVARRPRQHVLPAMIV